MNSLLKDIQRAKTKRILVLTAGSIQAGIQGLYFECPAGGWSMIKTTFIPYPAPLAESLASLAESNFESITPASFAVLDEKVSRLLIDCASSILSSVSKTYNRPHLIVLLKMHLSSDPSELKAWLPALGNASACAAQLGVPVVCDYNLVNDIRGGAGAISMIAGLCRMVGSSMNTFAIINIGLISRLWVIDTVARKILTEQDIGPGTLLINRAARECGCADGFDRDGTSAGQGHVDHACLDALISLALFTDPQKISFTTTELLDLYDHPSITALSSFDKLATLTALTARTGFLAYKRACASAPQLSPLWVSGGGANNLTLIDFMKTFSAPVSIARLDEIGIPLEAFISSAVGLTFGDYLWEKNPGPLPGVIVVG